LKDWTSEIANYHQWYAAIIREVSQAQKPKLSLAEQSAKGVVTHEEKFFGELDKYIDHDTKKLARTTLAQVAVKEWAAIETLLKMALTPALTG